MAQDSFLDPSLGEAMADNARETTQAQEMRALRSRLASGQGSDEELRETCRGFEALFMNKLWQEMRNTVPQDGYLHSQEEQFYVSLFDEELSNKMADAGGIGLADMLYRQLRESSENVSRTTSPSLMRESTPISPLRAEELDQEADLENSAPSNGEFDGSASAMYEAAGEEVEYVSLDAVEDALARGDNVSRTSAPAMDAEQRDLPRGTGSGDLAAEEPVSPEEVMRLATAMAGSMARVSSPPDEPGTSPGAAPLEESAPQEYVSPFGASPITPSVMTKVETLASNLEALRTPEESTGGLEGSAASAARDIPPMDAMSRAEESDLVSEGPLPVMQWPTDGQIFSGFGWRVDPFTGHRAFHAGVDIKADEGTPVTACWDGEVIFAGERGNYGQMVVLEHADGWRSYYGHNGSLDVEEGQMVRAGEVIASVGNTGRSTAPHLHFELRQRDMAWDPEQIQEHLIAGMPIGRDS
ncbi:MAG: hypothetical protein D6E12_02410 [Desulfovibrio sp.]|nr:MAG: hypothetical protein D6E12_02410 [Desulfovibrio sp.]